MERFLRDAADFLPLLLHGCVVTVQVTLCALALSTVLGFVWALMRISRHRAIANTARTLITIIRGLPILVQMFYIYFVLPDLGVRLDAFQAGFIGLGIAYSAYQAENFRAGILAIGRGQLEAGKSLGMSDWQVMRHVVLPQAIRVTLPPYGNTMIMMLKDSSQVSTITVAELTMKGQMLAASTFKNSTVFTLVALLYLVMSVPLILFVGWLEKRFGKK